MTDRRLLTRATESELLKLAQVSEEDRALAQLTWRERAPTLKLLLDGE